MRDAWSDSASDTDSSMPELATPVDSDGDSMPKLQTVSASTDPDPSEYDAHPFAADDSSTPPPPPPEPVPMQTRLAGVSVWLEVLPRAGELDAVSPEDFVFAAPVLPSDVTAAATSSQPVDLYNSGASHHMSPHCQDFVSLSETRMTFRAEGVGEMVVSVPNGSAADTRIHLNNILYAPDVGYNLISVGHIDNPGYATTFAGGNCTIVDENSHTVGTIPKKGGLYIVRRKRKEATAASTTIDEITEMEAHRCIAHIPIRAICELEGEDEADDDKSAMSEPEPPEAKDEPAAKPTMPIANLPPVPVSEPAARPTRARMPSRIVRDILEGRGADQELPPGIRVQDARDEEDAVEDLLEEVDGVAMAAAQAQEEGLDPASLAEAKHHPEWPRWEEAMKEEMDVLQKHRTWRLEQPPQGTNVVSCRWVFHAKKDMNGNVYRYRAHLVACGFSQIPGIDFFNTYVPVAKTASIRIALAFAARHDFEVHQVDVKSAYLNGEFDEHKVIYMSVPPGVQLTNDPALVLRLLCPLYGLRQSARHWHKKLRQVLEELLDMHPCDVDQAVFFRVAGSDLIVIVVHVDNLTIVASSTKLIVLVKSKLREVFEISDEGEIHWILGFAVICDQPTRTLSLSQTAYIEVIIHRFGLEDAKSLTTPMDPHVQLTTEQSPKTTAEVAEMQNVPYRKAVGSLMYTSLGTRPDITYAVSVLSRFSGMCALGGVQACVPLPRRDQSPPPDVWREGARPRGFHGHRWLHAQ